MSVDFLIRGSNEFEIPGAQSVPRPSGHILIGGKMVGDTLRCVHCQAHWVVIKGSRRKRGYCPHCNGPTCGSKRCHPCMYFMKRIEEVESGKRVWGT